MSECIWNIFYFWSSSRCNKLWIFFSLHLKPVRISSHYKVDASYNNKVRQRTMFRVVDSLKGFELEHSLLVKNSEKWKKNLKMSSLNIWSSEYYRVLSWTGGPWDEITWRAFYNFQPLSPSIFVKNDLGSMKQEESAYVFYSVFYLIQY